MVKNSSRLLLKMGQVRHIHLVGIGGVGMCGIAEVLHHQGYKVTGSDLSNSRAIEYLQESGIKVFIGHDTNHINGSDVLVYSTAITFDNPEVIAARLQNIPVIPRAAMLAELMRFSYGIAISGTHGKTTTTSLVSTLLAEGGLEPSFIIGGKLNSCKSNAHLGKSAYFVAEADESDASFLYLKPVMAIVTNIDADHMATYENNFDKLRNTFIEFIHQLPFYGLAVVCIEDKEIRQILPLISRPTKTYGFDVTADYQALNWTQTGMLSYFEVKRPKPHKNLTIQFSWPGRHNVLNALAAIAVATELGVSDKAIINGLATFQGVGRRFQMLGEKRFDKGLALVVDDYGHHPQEIQSTISAFRQVWPDKKLVHVFQPHRFTRTQSLFSQFVKALSLADELLLFDIYSAGETAIPGVSSQSLLEEINQSSPKGRLVNTQNFTQTLNEVITDGNVILMQGAGNIGQLAINLMNAQAAV